MSEPLQLPIVSHIMNHSKESPDDLAIVHRDTTITYGHLGRKIMSASDLLLDMGIVAAQRLPSLKKAGSFLIGFAVGMPIFNALIVALIHRPATSAAQGT